MFLIFDEQEEWTLNIYNNYITKGILMQIWKSPYMFVFMQKQYPENFAFLILRILELFSCEVCKFLRKLANF